MAGFEKLRPELEAVGARVFAASIDPIDKAREVAADVSFAVGYGVTRAQADALDAWWEERRSIIQPSEFVIDAGGKILASSYSDGPIGRIDAADVARLINFRESQLRK